MARTRTTGSGTGYKPSTVAQVRTLLERERAFLTRAETNRQQADRIAYQIGRTLWEDVYRGGRGKRGARLLERFCEEVAFGKTTQTAYNYVWFFRGVGSPEIIGKSGLPRKYFTSLGRMFGEDDFVTAIVRRTLSQCPVVDEDGDPDYERLAEIAVLVEKVRDRIIRLNPRGVFSRLAPSSHPELAGDPFCLEYLPGKPQRWFEESLAEANWLMYAIGRLLRKPFTPIVPVRRGKRVSVTLSEENKRSLLADTARGMLYLREREQSIRSTLNTASPETMAKVYDNVLLGRSEEVLRDRKMFKAETFDAVVTDVPYVAYSAWRSHTEVIHDAEETPEKQAVLVARVAEAILRGHLNKKQFIWFSFLPLNLAHIFTESLLEVFKGTQFQHQLLVWDKLTVPKIGGHTLFAPECEGILYINVGGRPLASVDSKGKPTPLHPDIFKYGVDKGDLGTYWKPASLIRELIWLTTGGKVTVGQASRQHILDPFAGSAVVGAMAVELGRRFTMIESHPVQYQHAQATIAEALKKAGRTSSPR